MSSTTSSLISKLTFAAALALSLVASTSHASQISVKDYPKQLTPRYPTFEEEAIVKTGEAVSKETLKYNVVESDNVCGNTGKSGATVKVYAHTSKGWKYVSTYGVPENGAFANSVATECK